MGRLMAFDVGTKRLGIAVTDPLKMFATALETIHPKDLESYLKKYLQTQEVETFIVGEPKQMNGTPSESIQHVKGFVTLLKKHFPDIPVVMMDERFTSKMASAAIAQSGLKRSDRQNKALVDSVAATIILQSYLEKLSLGF
ncbi:Holliday junction resolvase RuvX [Pelobium manganitolerans]|uniref:Holliday junction resolvase RuvX n=1 Tax=Pelobium manganitolerans TaxID=1842495 RepID=UPI003FA3658B